ASEKNWVNTFWKVLYYVMAGGLVSFVFFTICRTALLVIFGLTFLYGIISNLWLLKEKVYRLIIRWAALVLCAIITFPCVYGTIRYLPCILHHPVWFGAEYRIEKVHSFDPWDSWKYVSLEEFLETAIGRINYDGILEEEPEDVSSEVVIEAEDSVALVEVLDEQPEVLESADEGAGAEIVQEDDGLLRGEDALNSGKIRLEIWKNYLSDLNMTGHTVSEGHYQITEDFHAWHAQNIFIQMLYTYGIPAGVMFVLLMVWYGVRSLGLLWKAKEPTVLLPGMVFVVFMGFGLLECVWYPGQAILVLMYLAARRLLKNVEK
ncbi:MAG: O-antigen ligase family protein, partial [Lachnospiraceae bacterium]|nr:O-antigen ligase family protein [Lachnospiraceae bacterium]